MAGEVWTAAILLAFIVALPSLVMLFIFALMGAILFGSMVVELGLHEAGHVLSVAVLVVGIYALFQLIIAALQRVFFDRDCFFEGRWRMFRALIAGGWLLLIAMAVTYRELWSIFAYWQDWKTSSLFNTLSLGGWLLLPLIVMLLIDLQMTASKRRLAHV